MMRAVSAAMGRRGIAMMFEQGVDGIRKAAAATLTSSEMEKRFSSDLIIIRNYSTTSLVAAAEEKEIDKSLYLCFEDHDSSRVTHSIQSVRLSHVLAPPPPPPPPPPPAIRRRDLLDSESDDSDFDDDDELELDQVDEDDEKNILELELVAIRRGLMTRVPHSVRSTVIEGSKIVLFGGCISQQLGNLSHVYGFQTPRDPTVRPRRAYKPLPMIKNSPFLVEVDGKIYRFGYGYFRTIHSYYCNMCEFFEVFDDKEGDGEGKWLPLDVPPTDPKISAGIIRDPQFTCAVAGTNILIWAINHPGVGVSRFDVSHPEKGWTQLNSDLGDCIPSLGHAQILFLKLHPDRDRGFLMFSYTACLRKPNLQVFLVSHDCDSLKPMKSVPLPQMALDFCEMGCHFFHIQGPKFGLALFRPKRNCCQCCDDYYEKVRVAVITYEYQVITTHEDHDEPSSLEDVKYKLLSTCCLEYAPWRPCYDSTLVGAYVL